MTRVFRTYRGGWPRYDGSSEAHTRTEQIRRKKCKKKEKETVIKITNLDEPSVDGGVEVLEGGASLDLGLTRGLNLGGARGADDAEGADGGHDVLFVCVGEREGCAEQVIISQRDSVTF